MCYTKVHTHSLGAYPKISISQMWHFPGKRSIQFYCYGNLPAWLIRRWSWWQRLYGEQFLAALHRINASASQSKWCCWASNPHSDRNNQGLCHVAQLFYSIRQQCLEYTFALSNRLWNEVAIAKENKRISCEYYHTYNVITHVCVHTIEKKSKSKRMPYFFFLDEAISTLRMTKTLATERRNLIVTAIASSLRPGVYLFWSSFTSVPSSVSKSFIKL